MDSQWKPGEPHIDTQYQLVRAGPQDADLHGSTMHTVSDIPTPIPTITLIEKLVVTSMFGFVVACGFKLFM